MFKKFKEKEVTSMSNRNFGITTTATLKITESHILYAVTSKGYKKASF